MVESENIEFELSPDRFVEALHTGFAYATDIQLFKASGRVPQNFLITSNFDLFLTYSAHPLVLRTKGLDRKDVLAGNLGRSLSQDLNSVSIKYTGKEGVTEDKPEKIYEGVFGLKVGDKQTLDLLTQKIEQKIIAFLKEQKVDER